MANRILVDIEGLRERVSKAHDDNPLWSKLSMSQQLRQLIEEALEAAEKKKQGNQPAS
jgi:hypothetical protein